MIYRCVREHNGPHTLLWCIDLPGVCTRGADLQTAQEKMADEIRSFLRWVGESVPETVTVEITAECACDLRVSDADSDLLFDTERQPLTTAEYERLKALALRSAKDFYQQYCAIPDKNASVLPVRKTFYGDLPRTAQEMYDHTKNVNAYYFGEICVDADNEGSIWDCRARGFAMLEQQPDFLTRAAAEGSYGEWWSLRKLLRRFLWHDRIHARAMYRMACSTFGKDAVENVFGFDR